MTGLRVGLVVSSESWGGGEIVLAEIARHLSINAQASVTHFGDLPQTLPDISRHVSLGSPAKFSKRRPLIGQAGDAAVLLLRTFFKYRGLLRTHDVFLLQYKKEQLLLTNLLARYAPVIWWEHGPLPKMPRVVMALYVRLAKTTRVISVGQAVQQDLILRGVSSRLIRNPPPASAEFLLRSDDSLTDANRRSLDSRSIVYVGRLHLDKRLELLVDAARHLPAVQFSIVGDGPDRERLLSLSASLPNLTLLGHVDDPLQLIAEADALVLPSGQSAREGLPMALLEATAVGTPVIMCSDNHAAADGLQSGAIVCHPNDLSSGRVFANAFTRARPSVEALLQFTRVERTRWSEDLDSVFNDGAGKP